MCPPSVWWIELTPTRRCSAANLPSMPNFLTGSQEPRLLPLIGQLAEGASGPAAGEVAGEVAALAAALCGAAADRSRAEWPEAPGVRAQALSRGPHALASGAP